MGWICLPLWLFSLAVGGVWEGGGMVSSDGR